MNTAPKFDYSEMQAQQPALQPAAAALHPLTDSLRGAALHGLGQRIDKMFAGAGDVLLDLSARAQSEADRHAHFDAMRVLGFEQPRITRSFQAQISQGFRPIKPPKSMDLRLALLPAQELEENLALGHYAGAAKTRHRPQLDELTQRLEKFSREGAAPPVMSALTPRRFCEAYSQCMDALDLGFSVRKLLLSVFDRLVLSDLGGIYADMLALLDRHGVPGLDKPAASASPRIRVDASTMAMLHACVARGIKNPPNDAALAAEILLALPSSTHPATQRVTLVGDMFKSILADKQLPEDFLPLIEQFRLPLIKIGLSDTSFFLDALHPARRQLHDALWLALHARFGATAIAQKAAQRLMELRKIFDLSAGFVLSAMQTMEPLTPAEVTGFLDQQRHETDARRAEVLSIVRRTVAREIDTLTQGRSLHTGAQNFLRGGMAPLMSVRLLRYGVRSKLWKDALDHTGHILRSLEAKRSGREHEPERNEYMDAITHDFREIGLPEGKISALFRDLRGVYADLDQGILSCPDTQERYQLIAC